MWLMMPGRVAGRDDLHERGRQRVRRRHLEVEPAILVGDRLEARTLVLLAAVDLHLALARDDFVYRAGDLTHRLLDARPDAPVALADEVDDRGDQRREHEQRGGQAHARVQHHRRDAYHRQRVQHDRLERIGAGAGDLLHREGQARDHLARGFGAEIARGQLEVAREHLAAQPVHDAACDARHAVVGHVGRDAAQQEQADDDDRHPRDPERVVLDEDVVEHRLDALDERRTAGRVERSTVQRSGDR